MRFHGALHPFLLPFLEFSLLLILGEGIIAAQPQGAENPYIVGNGVKPPVAIYQPLPPYTAEARNAHVEGVVALVAIIRKDGTVDSFRVVRSLGYGLDESAINTIAAKWRFKPGTFNGVPVDVQANIEVSFRLYKDEADKAQSKEYPLRVAIVEAHFERNPYGDMSGSGYGNVKDGNSYRGFDFTFSCDRAFSMLQDGRTYPAKWITQDASLVVLDAEIGNSTKQKECELRVKLIPYIYSKKDGRLMAVPKDE